MASLILSWVAYAHTFHDRPHNSTNKEEIPKTPFCLAPPGAGNIDSYQKLQPHTLNSTAKVWFFQVDGVTPIDTHQLAVVANKETQGTSYNNSIRNLFILT